MRTVTVYSKHDCHLCADALAALRALQVELGFDLRELDITKDDELHRAYFVDERLLRERLESGR